MGSLPVPKEKAASAITLMFTGLTVAPVTGVPLGTFIGQTFGWQSRLCWHGVLSSSAMCRASGFGGPVLSCCI